MIFWLLSFDSLLFKKSSVDYIENCKNCNCNCKIGPPIDSIGDSFNIQGMNNFFEEQEDNPINHEQEKSKSHEDEREAENF